MSAIVGVCFFDGRPVDRDELARMTDRLAHRGPDGAGTWAEGSVGLGNCLLWTTTESRNERLPRTDASGDLAITADARIDNRDDLIAALGLTDRQPESPTDGDLILAAYERWGEDCVAHLVGDFAFTIWDGRRQALFCARDHLGVKPFYYHRSDRLFAFASEIKALFCLPDVPRRLDEVRVGDYLVPMLEDKAVTFYRDILRLPPAQAMTVSEAGARIRRYWQLDPGQEIRLGSDEAYAEAFREQFTEAVRCRLRSAFPVGSLLSGGLDSSSIVCTAHHLRAQNGSRPLHTFSAIFDDVRECDERPFINAVLAQARCEPHFMRADRLSPLTDVDRVFWCQDEPFYAPNLFIHWGLYRAATRADVRILLDGLDGDTTVSHGFAYLTELARAGRWLKVAKNIRDVTRKGKQPSWPVVRHRILGPLAPPLLRRSWRFLNRPSRSALSRNPTIRADFARRIGLEERFRAFQGERPRPALAEREDHYRRLMSGFVPFYLEVADKAAAMFSLEPRYPFFDKRLVEFSFALPAEQKLARGWTRLILRRAMQGILPPEVQWRGNKSNLSANFRRGFATTDKHCVEKAIQRDSSPIAAYVDLPALRDRYSRYLAERNSDDGLTVWKATTLALWLDHTGVAA